MHEFSITEALFEQIDLIGKENNFAKVTEIHVELGALRLIIPEMMQTAFSALSQASFAEGAKLKLIEKKALAKCRSCQKEFCPQIQDFQCPTCSEADVAILEGNDIILLFIKGIQKGGSD